MNAAALMLVEICLFLPIFHYLPKNENANRHTLKYSFKAKGYAFSSSFQIIS